jgi:tetratricopeptide (TPR) repeat protein
LVGYTNGIYQIQEHTFSDMLEFDRLWEQAHALQWEDRFSVLRSAAVLYRGAFLNGITGHAWRDEIANKYRKRMGWLKWQLAGLYFRDGQNQEAINLLEDAIDINPYFQNGIEDLMRVLHYQEEHAQAVHSFNLWAARLKADLDIEPSDRLKSVQMRVADAMPVTRAFSSGTLSRAGMRGPRSLPRLTAPPALTSQDELAQQPYVFAANMDEMKAKMRATGYVPEDERPGYIAPPAFPTEAHKDATK